MDATVAHVNWVQSIIVTYANHRRPRSRWFSTLYLEKTTARLCDGKCILEKVPILRLLLSFLRCGVRYVSFHLMGLRRPNLSLNNRTLKSSIEAFHVQKISCRIKYIIPANVLKKKWSQSDNWRRRNLTAKPCKNWKHCWSITWLLILVLFLEQRLFLEGLNNETSGTCFFVRFGSL